MNNLDFVGTMKPFHDKYSKSRSPLPRSILQESLGLIISCVVLPLFSLSASETTKFAIGETGLGVAADMSARLEWLQQMTSQATKDAMPHLISVSWFNYMKGYDFRVAGKSVDQGGLASYLKA